MLHAYDSLKPSLGILCLAALLVSLGAVVAAQELEAPAVVAAAEQRLASGASEEIEISAGCASDGPYREVRIFGRGVGIWKRSAQFAVAQDVLGAMLSAFRLADFDDMPAVIGSKEPDLLHRGPRIICQASLTAGRVTKQVVQLEKGEQSERFRILANTILDLAEERAGSAVTTSSLEDGLAGIASGRLAPETLELTIHHQPERGGRRRAGGWTLHVEEGLATADEFAATAASPTRASLRLTARDLMQLVDTLGQARIAALPGNVYLADYTDIHVRVLDRERQIQAREFAGMSPESQARGRNELERLLASLSALHRRVLDTGQPAGQ